MRRTEKKEKHSNKRSPQETMRKIPLLFFSILTSCTFMIFKTFQQPMKLRALTCLPISTYTIVPMWVGKNCTFEYMFPLACLKRKKTQLIIGMKT